MLGSTDFNSGFEHDRKRSEMCFGTRFVKKHMGVRKTLLFDASSWLARVTSLASAVGVHAKDVLRRQRLTVRRED